MDVNKLMNKPVDFALPEIDLEFIVKYGPGYIYWKNLDSVYIGCNQNFATVCGLESPSDIIGML